MANKVVVNINQYRSEVFDNVDETKVDEGIFAIYYRKDDMSIVKGYPLSAIESFEISIEEDEKKKESEEGNN